MVDVTKKVAYCEDIEKKMTQAKVMVLMDFSGVNVEQVNRLRKEIRELGDEVRVVRNTLVKRVAKKLGHDALLPHLEGPTAIAFGYKDPVAPVKALVKQAGEIEKLKFKTGFLDGRLLDPEQIKALSKLPGRNELLSMLLSVLQGPMRNLVGVLSGPIRKLAYALEAIRKQKEQAGGSAA